MNRQEAEAMVEKARERIGDETVAVSDPVSLRQIKEFLAGTDDWDPLYYDEEAARQGPYGEIIAPPLFYAAPLRKVVPESSLLEDGQHKGMAAPGVEGRSLHGGAALELHNPVRVGDIVTSRSQLKDVWVKEGRSGTLVFQLRETRFTDQDSRLLAVESTTLIFR